MIMKTNFAKNVKLEIMKVVASVAIINSPLHLIIHIIFSKNIISSRSLAINNLSCDDFLV
jgi:hypothetical protein